MTEPLHTDVRGDWRCNVSWHHAGTRITVGVVFKPRADGQSVVVATVFEG